MPGGNTNLCVIVLLFACSTSGIVIDSYQSNSSDSNLWEVCWYSQSSYQDMEQLAMSMGQCLKKQMYESLSENLERQCVDAGDGVTYFSAEDNLIAPRDIFPQGEEPSSLRGLMDSYSSYLSRRGLQWNLGHLYPGLVMTVEPTLSANGLLKFEARPLDLFERSQLGPGQHLLRRTLLPHLLEFRMNLLQLLPLMFGILVYVSKNAFIFSKVSLIISTLLALKSLFVLQHFRPPNPHGPFHDITDTSVSGSDVLPAVRPGPGVRPHQAQAQAQALQPDLVMQLFASAIPPFRGVNDYYPQVDKRGNRNFSWE